MKHRLAEESVLFISIIKWVVLATCVGLIVGLATAGFLRSLAWSTSLAHRWSGTIYLLPLALSVSSLLVKWFAPEAEGHGTEKVIEAIHRRAGRIKAAVVPVKVVVTVLTLALGGSAGKEGPCAQIGGGLSSLFADLLRFSDQDRKKLVICGISAGFASVFGAPIAGSIFGVEVLFVGTILYDVLLPSFIAGVTSFQVAKALRVEYFHHNLSFTPVFSEAFFLKVMLAGIFFGLCSMLLIEILKAGEWLSRRLRIWMPLKGLLGGAAMLALALLFSRDYLGLGLETIESCLRGNASPWYAFLLKPVFTSLTLNFGGSGGIVTPIFFVGATSGTLFATLLHQNVPTFAAIGTTSLLAGAANTPIAASILTVELFGPAVAPYAAVACVISFLMTGHRSVYPSQILSMRKSASIDVEIGREVDQIEARFKGREKSLTGQLLRAAKYALSHVRPPKA
ncbi:chloride channel protein [Geothrix alkalitolerans]|uniref:chloride channel protein n=1 Tax=Geothrix alkalitolerans TaxID=2922724 RepID=UPI001FB02488|nr:chloride channel protein [Geothrix alkalitolerans]